MKIGHWSLKERTDYRGSYYGGSRKLCSSAVRREQGGHKIHAGSVYQGKEREGGERQMSSLEVKVRVACHMYI